LKGKISAVTVVWVD